MPTADGSCAAHLGRILDVLKKSKIIKFRPPTSKADLSELILSGKLRVVIGNVGVQMVRESKLSLLPEIPEHVARIEELLVESLSPTRDIKRCIVCNGNGQAALAAGDVSYLCPFCLVCMHATCASHAVALQSPETLLTDVLGSNHVAEIFDSLRACLPVIEAGDASVFCVLCQEILSLAL